MFHKYNIKKQTLLAFLLSISLFSCVSENINTTEKPVTNETASSSPSSNPSSIVSPSNKPVETTNPEVKPSPLPDPVPTISPSSNESINRSFILGVSDVFENVVNKNSTDEDGDTNKIVETIKELNTQAIIIDFKQVLIDPNLDGDLDNEDGNWVFYDRMITNLPENTKVIFRFKFDDFPGKTLDPTVPEFYDFFRESVKRYENNKNVAWMLGDKINNKNEVDASFEEYSELLKTSYGIVKSQSKDIKFYLGSLAQSEDFGEPHYYSAENLLELLNLDTGNFFDGIVLEAYSLGIQGARNGSSTIYDNKDHRLVADYYKSFDQVLKLKGLDNKEKIIISGTFGDSSVEDLTQKSLEQGNDIIRRAVYSIDSGFDQFYLPKLIDSSSFNERDFEGHIGIINKTEGLTSNKKVGFWSYKFLLDKIGNKKYVGRISNLPQDIEGFIFEGDSSLIYIIWNNSEDVTSGFNIKLPQENLNLYSFPRENETIPIGLNRVTGENKEFNLTFVTNPFNPVLLEMIK